MFFLDELNNLKVYRKKFLLPINDKDKRHNSLAFLMTPNYESSLKMMKHPLFENRYFNSYYIERAAMYYVDGSTRVVEEDCSIVTEASIDNIMKNDLNVIYHGYSNDAIDVKNQINPRTFLELEKSFGVTVPSEITIEIFRRPVVPNSTYNTINVCSIGSYNKKLKNYNSYLSYVVYMYLMSLMEKPWPMEMRYAVALVMSGLYEIHKSDWIFDDKLKVYCAAVDYYNKKKGLDKLISDLNKDPSKVFFRGTYKDFIKTDVNRIASLFGYYLKESDEPEKDLGMDQPGLIQVGENCLMVLNEDSVQNQMIRKMIYNDRIKNLKELQALYDQVKNDVSYIKYTYNTIDRYNGLNLIVDMYKYNESFITNNTFQRTRGYNVYLELMRRLIGDKRFSSKYKLKTVIIPVLDWDVTGSDKKMWLIKDSINPISCIYQSLMIDPNSIKREFPNTIFLFMGNNGYFKIDFNTFDFKKQSNMFIRNIRLLRDKKYVPEEDTADTRTASPKAITTSIVDKIEKTQGVQIDDISKATDAKVTNDTKKPKKEKVSDVEDLKKSDEKEDKDELVEKIGKAAKISDNEDDAIDELDKDDKIKQILADLAEDPDDKSNISAARASRMIKLHDDLMEKEFRGKPLKAILAEEKDPMEKPLTTASLKIDSVNDEWKDLHYISSFDDYKPDEDIVKIFDSFKDMTHPLVIKEIKVEDNSTSEDVVDLYTVQYEDENGKRFTIKIDVPKFIDNKYLKLRGNRKDISSQLFLMPISKTDEDTVQIVSNYKKIFIRRYGTTTGKSNVCCDRLIKAITRNKVKGLTYTEGYNVRICSRYELPIDYIDLASVFNTISTDEYDLYFNPDELYDKYGSEINLKNGVPIGYDKKSRSVVYYKSRIEGQTENITLSYWIALLISESCPEFMKLYDNASTSVRYTYSMASLMAAKIPLIVVCAYSEGLIPVLKKANIKYRLEETRRGMNKDTEDSIRFKDGYLIYTMDYASSLLMNGLKACNTDDYSLADMNSKGMYLDFLDQFGGRIKADGLDNFYNLMIDKPITYNSLKYYKLPTDYISVLLYANRLLVDNKFYKHTNIVDNRRIRRNEQVPAMLYQVLSTAYGDYCTQKKHGRNAPLTVKQTALIDGVLLNSTTQDKSIINALNEYEAYTTVTPKGPSGMNSDRSYTLDKRAYDESMFGVLGMSTGFAGNVGISRQATIDASISTPRGYITNKNVDRSKISTTKSLCMTEALTPFGTTRDDPFRTAMTYIQTSKHYVRCRRSNPSLITTGADEALPYMISNIFAKKADKNGKVVDVNEERMLVEYSDGTKDYINLEEGVEKNSSSGFYVTLKLDTDLKPGKTFKAGEILAYDKTSFSRDVGATDNLAYDIGTIAKVAIMNTDEGYEDSAIISEKLSEDMASDIVLMCPNHPIVLAKDTNIYNLVKKGQHVEEGDPLLIVQRPYDEEDANILLKKLVDDPEEISDLGRIPIRSKVTGTVQDIAIYRTVDISELSPSLKKIVNQYENNIKRKKKEMEENGIQNADFIVGSTDKLPAVGKLKNASDGVAIEIYIKYEDKMKVGDKAIYYSALKGTVKDVFPEGKEPRSEYRPNETVDSLLAIGSINGRMVTSVLINGAIYKYLIELGRQCKDILGIKYSDDLFEK